MQLNRIECNILHEGYLDKNKFSSVHQTEIILVKPKTKRRKNSHKANEMYNNAPEKVLSLFVRNSEYTFQNGLAHLPKFTI